MTKKRSKVVDLAGRVAGLNRVKIKVGEADIEAAFIIGVTLNPKMVEGAVAYETNMFLEGTTNVPILAAGIQAADRLKDQLIQRLIQATQGGDTSGADK